MMRCDDEMSDSEIILHLHCNVEFRGTASTILSYHPKKVTPVLFPLCCLDLVLMKYAVPYRHSTIRTEERCKHEKNNDSLQIGHHSKKHGLEQPRSLVYRGVP